MSSNLLASQVRSLEAQLAVLRAGLADVDSEPSRGTLGDLYGVLRGRADSTWEELNEANYRVDEGPFDISRDEKIRESGVVTVTW
jgi:hypothetical protein